MESSTLNEEELLSDQLKNVIEEYYQFGGEETRQALLRFLKNNDCREVIGKCVDGDDIANAFVWAGYRNHSDVLEAFLKQGMNIDTKNIHCEIALFGASYNCNEVSVRLLIEHNANPNLQENSGSTPLMCASQTGRKEIVQLLLSRNADVDFKTNFGQTALDLAKTNEIKDMIRNHVNNSYILK